MSKCIIFESDHFISICALLDFHVSSKKPLTMVSGAILINPVLNDDKWLVTPEEIEKIRDLGKGAFGEVYEGEWKGQRVAVKSCHFSCHGKGQVFSNVKSDEVL